MPRRPWLRPSQVRVGHRRVFERALRLRCCGPAAAPSLPVSASDRFAGGRLVGWRSAGGGGLFEVSGIASLALLACAALATETPDVCSG